MSDQRISSRENQPRESCISCNRNTSRLNPLVHEDSGTANGTSDSVRKEVRSLSCLFVT